VVAWEAAEHVGTVLKLVMRTHLSVAQRSLPRTPVTEGIRLHVRDSDAKKLVTVDCNAIFRGSVLSPIDVFI